MQNSKIWQYLIHELSSSGNDDLTFSLRQVEVYEIQILHNWNKKKINDIIKWWSGATSLVQ